MQTNANDLPGLGNIRKFIVAIILLSLVCYLADSAFASAKVQQDPGDPVEQVDKPTQGVGDSAVDDHLIWPGGDLDTEGISPPVVSYSIYLPHIPSCSNPAGCVVGDGPSEPPCWTEQTPEC